MIFYHLKISLDLLSAKQLNTFRKEADKNKPEVRNRTSGGITMKKYFLICLLFSAVVFQAQDKKAYQLFDKNGKKTTYKKLLKEAGLTQGWGVRRQSNSTNYQYWGGTGNSGIKLYKNAPIVLLMTYPSIDRSGSKINTGNHHQAKLKVEKAKMR